MSVPIEGGTAWADLDDDEESDLEIYDFEDWQGHYDDLTSTGQNCCRSAVRECIELTANTAESCLATSWGILQTVDITMEASCIGNEFNNAATVCAYCIEKDLGKPDSRLAVCDAFLRQRHEVLHGMSISAVGLVCNKSDMCFSSVFPIDSNRTPDYLHRDDYSMLALIVETTVSTDKGKSYQQKGRIESGYQSKYESELEDLRRLGYKTHYVVLHFDSRDLFNEDYLIDLNNIANLLGTAVNRNWQDKLEVTRRAFCNIQHKMGKKLSQLLSLLFVDEFSPAYYPNQTITFLRSENQPDLPTYKRVLITNQTYNRIHSSWIRLDRMIESMEDHNAGYKLRMDLVTGKLGFAKSADGPTQREWQSFINDQDKPSVFKNLVTHVGEVLTPETSGKIEYFEKTLSAQLGLEGEIYAIDLHDSSAIICAPADLPDYSHYIRENEYMNMPMKFDRFDVDEAMIDKFSEVFKQETLDEFFEFSASLKNKVPFASNVVCKSKIIEAVQMYNEKYDQINNFNDNTTHILHQKPSFIYPLFNINASDYQDYREKDPKFLSLLNGLPLGDFTRVIISGAISDKFSFGSKPKEAPARLTAIDLELADLHRQVHKIQMSSKIDGKIIKAKDLEDCKQLLSDIKSKRSEMRQVCAETGYKGKEISTIRLPTHNKKRRTTLGSKFNEEMSHFRGKDEVANYKGVGRYNYDCLKQLYSLLKNVMLSPAKVQCDDRIYDEFVANDASLLKQTKIDTIEKCGVDNIYLRNTNIYHCCAMITRMCYTIMFFSQTAVGSDYVFLDNLGLKNVLLICKGGKKIFRTKKSKLFKLFFPTFECAVDHYCMPGYNSSFRCHRVGNDNLIETPWMVMDETLLSDGLTFLSRTMGYVLVNRNISPSIGETLSACFFNIILGLNGRRQTEEFMHNMRYITVNCMSVVANLDKMLPELANFNYDFMQCFLRESISENFLEFASSLINFHENASKRNTDEVLEESNVTHLMDREVMITNSEQLTMVIYCTFLMSKAPVTQSLEQVRNLKGMLKTHQYFKLNCHDELEGKYLCDTSLLEDHSTASGYWESLFENDFKYDPTYVTTVGKFAADYLSNVTTSQELYNKWDSILKKPWDGFANTSGLRGVKERSSTYFGKKGYYIVYEEVLSDPNYLSEVKQLLNSDETDFLKRKRLNQLNQTFKDKLNQFELTEVCFHVVDKKQRGGSREIFVMDVKTKIHQQPIEKFLAHLCKLVPNELISIPSNKRLAHIHSNVHERFKDDTREIFSLSFDCRRWAPHSNITKFIDFILAMKGFLPKSFVTHLVNFMQMMINNKKVYTRDYVFDIMKGSKSTSKEFLGYMENDEGLKAHYFNMSYSWMMGIFNYLSSLLHVFNQLHASQLISKMVMRYQKEEANLHMTAHSDDSAGKLCVSDELTMRKCLLVYEVLLKGCNHLLSDKKCNVSKVYFELLSILYIGDRLMSLLPKFAGTFTFHPTDGGFCSDIFECYSKCTELVINGATFEQAYMSMKIMSYLIWRFYFGKNVPEIYYTIPPQLVGMPDSHPLNIMLSGSDAELIRIELFEQTDLGQMSSFSKFLADNNDFDDSFISPLRASPRIIMSKEYKGLADLMGRPIKEEYGWILKNIKFNNTGMNLLAYLGKLGERSFLAAMQDETLTRRISRAFYYRNAGCIDTTRGLFTYKQVKELMNLYLALSRGDSPLTNDFIPEVEELRAEILEIASTSKSKELFNLLHSEVLAINRAMDNISYRPEQVVSSHKTCKPIHINVQRVNSPMTSDFDPAMLTCWLKQPDKRWLLPPQNYVQQSTMLEDYLTEKGISLAEVDPNWLHKLLSKYKGRYLKEYFLYSNMPASCRDINNYKDVLYFLSHNSFPNKYIEGVISPYNRTMNITFDQVFEDLLSPDIATHLSVLDFMTGLFDDRRMYNLVDSLKVNGSNERGVAGVMQILKSAADDISKQYMISNMVVPHINGILKSDHQGSTNCHMELSRSFFHCFTKKQHLVGNVWLGKGKLFVNMPTIKILFTVENQRLSGCTVDTLNCCFSKHEVAYVDYVLATAQLNNLKSHMVLTEPRNWLKVGLGIDSKGSFCVGQSRYLTMSLPFTNVDKLPHKMLCNLFTTQIKIKPRLKYEVTYVDSMGEKQRCILHTFDMPVTGLLKNINRLFDNEENRIIAANHGEEYSSYIEHIIGSTTLSDLYIGLNDMVTLYQSSVLYSIIKSVKDKDLVSLTRLGIRRKTYPGQEGGLLDILMKYKTLNPNFLFDYDKVLTPELMHMKSTQPDIFVSNLVTNLKMKYDNLYGKEDKSAILTSLHRISEALDDPNLETQLIKVLTTWGYIGVMGALSEGLIKKDPKGFGRHYINDDSHTLNSSMNCLTDFFDVLTDSVKNSGVGMRLAGLGFYCNLTQESLAEKIKGFIHMQCLGCMTKKYTNNSASLTTSWLWLETILGCLSLDERFLSTIEEEIASKLTIFELPFNKAFVTDWIRCLQTWVNNVCSRHKFDVIKNNNLRLQRMPIGVMNYKSIAQLMSKNADHTSIRNIYHNGTIEPELLYSMTQVRTIKTSKGLYRLKPTLAGLSAEVVPFNKSYFVKMPLNEDYLDSDEWGDFKIELQSSEMDLDDESLQPNDDSYEEKYERQILIRHNGTLQKAKQLDVTLINLIGHSTTSGVFDRIRQSGETLVVLSEVFHLPLIGLSSETPNIMIFQMKNRPILRSTIPKEMILVYCIDSEPIDSELMCKYLDADALSHERVSELVTLNTWGSWTLKTGLKVNLKNPEDLSAQYENIVKHSEEMIRIREEEIEKLEEIKETTAKGVSAKIMEMDKDVYDVAVLKKYAKRAELARNPEEAYDFMSKVATAMLNEGGKSKAINEKVSVILSRPKDSKFIEKVYEVPEVFQTGRHTISDVKNKALKDMRVRAEIESMHQGLTNLLLSNRLDITEKDLNKMKRHVNMWSRYSTENEKDSAKKKFLINLIVFIVNDANVTTDSKNQSMWTKICDRCDELIVPLDDDATVEEEVYSKPSGMGVLNYRII